MILSDEEWRCVDRSRNDMLLMAWREFSRENTCALHAPVHCTLHLYHAHGGVLMGQVLPALQQALDSLDLRSHPG